MTPAPGDRLELETTATERERWLADTSADGYSSKICDRQLIAMLLRDFAKLEAEATRLREEHKALLDLLRMRTSDIVALSTQVEQLQAALTTSRSGAVAETEAAIMGWLNEMADVPLDATNEEASPDIKRGVREAFRVVARAIAAREYLPRRTGG